MRIEKRNGNLEEFDITKIQRAIEKALLSSNQPNTSREIAELVALKCYDGISVEEIQDYIVKELPEPTRNAFVNYRRERNNARFIEDKYHLSSGIKLTANALITLQARYLLKDSEGNIIEKPEELFDRVARYVGIVELYYEYLYNTENVGSIYGKLNDMEISILERLIERNKKFFGDDRVTIDQLKEFAETKKTLVKSKIKKYSNLMKSLRFLPNSPTLMNAGTPLGELSACFVLGVPDSIDGIFDALKYQAKIQKAGGGTGFSFSSLRGSGSIVGSTKGVASGAVSFMEMFDKVTDVIKQGGKRRGANMGVLRYDHPDIMEFITSKDVNNTRLSNFNISVGVDQKFFDAVTNGEDIELKNSNSDEVVGKIPANDMMKAIIHRAWLTGDPGLLFLDRMNENNPVAHISKIEATNPCVTGDTLLYTSNGILNMKYLHEQGRGINPVIDNRITGDKMGIGSNVFSTGIKSVYKLKTNEGYYLKATNYHPIFSEDRGEMVELKDLKIGERIRVLGSGGAFGNYGNLKLGRVLGSFIGDGSLSKTRNPSHVAFWGDERELADMFKGYVSDIAHRELKVREIENRDESMVASVSLTTLAKQYGIYDNKLKVPEVVFFGTKEMQVGFLQGLFQADGTINYSKSHSTRVIRLGSVSEELLEGVQMILLNFGIYSKIYLNRKPEGEKLMPDGKGGKKMYHSKPFHELVISNSDVKKFSDEINFIGSVKRNKLAEMIDGAHFRDSKFVARVKSISYIGEEEVFDLTEYVSHSLVCNGIVTSNCGEQPLIPYDSCTLGSIDLGKYVVNGSIDYDRLKSDIKTAYHFLDDVVDANNYPVEKIAEVSSSTRKIGLGYMGFADALIKMGIPYNTEEARVIGEKVMKILYDVSKKESEITGKIRGAYPYDIKSGMRNSTVVTIAPTGTISIIAGCSSGIEPLFALAFTRNVLNGKKLSEFVSSVRDYLMKYNLYSKEIEDDIYNNGVVSSPIFYKYNERGYEHAEVLKTAMEINYQDHIRMQAVFQKHCDASISKTINMRNDATENDIMEAYFLARKLGCKGITVFRDGSKSVQVLEIKKKPELVLGDDGVPIDPNCRSGKCTL